MLKGGGPFASSRDTQHDSHHLLRKAEQQAARPTAGGMPLPLSLTIPRRKWHAACDTASSMIRIRPNCPISARATTFAARRIAPVAPTLRVEDRGARSSPGAEQPAQTHAKRPAAEPRPARQPYAASFVSQILGQEGTQRGSQSIRAARSYEAADRIDAPRWQWLSTRL